MAGWKTFSDSSHFSYPSQNFVYCSILLKTFSKEKPSHILLKDASQISLKWKSFSKASQRLPKEIFYVISVWNFYLEPLKCIPKIFLSKTFPRDP